MSQKKKLLLAFFFLLTMVGAAISYLNLGSLFRYESNRPSTIAPAQSSAVVAENEEPDPVVHIPEDQLDQSPEETPQEDLPTGKLIITKERTQYVDMALTLSIPALNLVCPVYDGTTAEILSKMGACLYEYAQLPGEGNRNTSLAGHRNTRRNGIITDQAPFYYIDLLAEGDLIYLYNAESIYRYTWDSTQIVEQDDWDMIRTTGFSCVTITSCHPIGIADHRIVTRGRLDEIVPYRADYPFPASSKGDTSS